MSQLNSSRILGGLLCIASAFVAIIHVAEGYWGSFFGSPRIPLVFALPVTIILLIATSLGFWLGWIMVTTKEAEPTPAPRVEEEESEVSEE